MWRRRGHAWSRPSSANTDNWKKRQLLIITEFIDQSYWTLDICWWCHHVMMVECKCCDVRGLVSHHDDRLTCRQSDPLVKESAAPQSSALVSDRLRRDQVKLSSRYGGKRSEVGSAVSLLSSYSKSWVTKLVKSTKTTNKTSRNMFYWFWQERSVRTRENLLKEHKHSSCLNAELWLKAHRPI